MSHLGHGLFSLAMTLEETEISSPIVFLIILSFSFKMNMMISLASIFIALINFVAVAAAIYVLVTAFYAHVGDTDHIQCYLSLREYTDAYPLNSY